jgi:hypothetical protein
VPHHLHRINIVKVNIYLGAGDEWGFCFVLHVQLIRLLLLDCLSH